MFFRTTLSTALRTATGVVGLVLAAAVAFGGAAEANATVAPGNGPTPGGTSVQLDAARKVNYTQMAAGGFHTVAFGSDGNAYAWGWNGDGQLGNGSTSDSSVPVRISAPAGVKFTQVAAGYDYTVAVGSDENTYAWGSNHHGQLGNGSTTDSSVPVLVSAPAGVTFTQVAAGGYHTVAVGSDGHTYTWGAGSYGQLGNGSRDDSSVPVRVTTPDGVKFTQVTAGHDHTVAVESDENAYAWGRNSSGQLGDGSNTEKLVPTPVVQPSVTSVTFGGVNAPITSQADGVVTVTTPAHASGVVDVALTWSDGYVDTRPAAYSYGAAPVITASPQSTTLPQNGSTELTATATGDETPTVQWQYSPTTGDTWADLPGATTTSLNVNQAGLYRAVFTNPLGSATTSTATVSGVPDPSNLGTQYSVSTGEVPVGPVAGGKHTITAKLADADANPVPGQATQLKASTLDALGSGKITGFTETSTPGTYTAKVTSSVSGDKTITVNFAGTPATLVDNNAASFRLAMSVKFESVEAGTRQVAYGHDFTPGETVTGVAHSTPTSLGEETADANGDVVFDFVVPEDTKIGTHTITLTGPESGSVQADYTVVTKPGTAVTPHTPLAVTGSNPALPGSTGNLLGGIGALLAGALLVHTTKRRRDTPPRITY